VTAHKPPLWLVYASSALILSGIQAMLPVLPALQQELDLSDSQVSLLITVYVLPSALFAIPITATADRVGRRPILVWALAIFGLGGGYLVFRHTFAELLVVRAIQGLCFAPVIPLGITLIGDHLSGPSQVSAQSKRVVAMNIGNAFLPAASGIVGTVAWYAPFAIQTFTLPLALAAFRQLPGKQATAAYTQVTIRSALRTTLKKRLLPIHATALLRFFFRYALLTYLPILLAQRFGSSTTTIGLVLGATAAAGTVGAGSAARLATRIPLITLLTAGFLGIGVGLVGVATAAILAPVIMATVVYGLSDGVFTVVHASLLTEAVPRKARASMVGVTGGMKNVGQLLGPSFVGLVLLLVPLGAAFAVLGAMSLASMSLARVIGPSDETHRSTLEATK